MYASGASITISVEATASPGMTLIVAVPGRFPEDTVMSQSPVLGARYSP